MRIKFCGITSAVDAHAAIALGVDALGFVFYAPSPRYVSPSDAARIIRTLPPLVSKVGLFVNASPQAVREAVAASGVDVVQYHGDEAPARCGAIDRPWIKALRVRAAADVSTAMTHYGEASALLLDAYDPDVYGGTGKTFDWSLIPAESRLPLILAGGLTAENVGTAIRAVRPYAVDVSGGIELRKGVKDHAKMEKFVNEVKHVECQT